MKFQKIKVNDGNLYSCYYIHKVENEMIECCIVGEDLASIRKSFSKISEVTTYNEDGTVNYITNTFNKMSDVRVHFEYMRLKLSEIEDKSLLSDEDVKNMESNPDSEKWFSGIQVTIIPYDDIKDQVASIKETLKIDIDTEAMSADEYKNYVIDQMSQDCSNAITNGVDVETTQGKLHFSYAFTDQLNLKTLVMTAEKGLSYPYYTSDSECHIFTAEDVISIWANCEGNLLYQRAYFNSLMEYIKTMDNKEDLAKVKFGMELPKDYSDKMNESINCGKAITEAILEKYQTK